MTNKTYPNVIHFAPDDKACRGLRSLYSSAFPAQHRFISYPYFGDRSATRPNTLEFTDNDRFITDDRYWQSRELDADCHGADIIFLHSLQNCFFRVLEAAPRDCIVAWNSWGGDVYRYIPEFRDAAMVLPATLRVANFHPRDAGSSLDAGHAARDRGWVSRKVSPLRTFLRHVRPPALKVPWDRIDYFAGQEFVYNALQRTLPGFRADHARLGWYALDEPDATAFTANTGLDIQIGHSAWPMNNHIEVIAMLSEIDLTGRKVIFPLSYGSADYAARVEKCSRDLLNCTTVVLKDFLPIDEYTNIVRHCGVLIMNSVRTVGWGNILAQFARGGRVVLSRRNPLLSSLKALGYSIDAMPSTPRNLAALLQPRSLADQVSNRNIAYTMHTRSTVQESIAEIYRVWRAAQHAGSCGKPSWLWS